MRSTRGLPSTISSLSVRLGLAGAALACESLGQPTLTGIAARALLTRPSTARPLVPGEGEKAERGGA
jgi:hypothetical protein